MAPYPTSTAQSKHDLVCRSWPDFDPVYESLEEVLEALRESRRVAPIGIKRICAAYSYEDAPSPTLVHPIVIIGYVSVEVVASRLRSMNCCVLATKRADGDYGRQLDDRNRTNAENFRRFTRELHRSKRVAVSTCDKRGRLCLIRHERYEDNDNNNDAEPTGKHAYAGACHYGTIDDFQRDWVPTTPPWSFESEEITLGCAPSTPPGPPPTTNDEEPMWKPEEENNTNDELMWRPDDDIDNGNDPMWRPDDDTNGDDNNDRNPMWKPEAEEETMWKPENDTNDENNANNNENGNKNDEEDWGASTSLWSSNNENDVTTTSTTVTTGNDETATTTMNNLDTPFHSNRGAADADNFYSNLTRTLDTRTDSRLFHMRNFNGWVKATLIAELDPKTNRTDVKRRRRGFPLRVLDLACGKGGDLGKWILHDRGVDRYVGADVARGSLSDAAKRARRLGASGRLCRNASLLCADLGEDVPGKRRHELLTWNMADDLGKGSNSSNNNNNNDNDPVFAKIPGGGVQRTDKFDVVSIQFAVHYMFQTRARARRFFKTVGDLLEIGGNLVCTTVDARVVLEKLMGSGEDLRELRRKNEPTIVKAGGGVCNFKFEPDSLRRVLDCENNSSSSSNNNNNNNENNDGDADDRRLFGLEYTFTLVEGDDHSGGVGQAVDLPEWLVPLSLLRELAEEAGLEMESCENFHEFYRNRRNPGTHAAAHGALYNMKVLDVTGSISEDEWDVSRVYMAVKFTKVRNARMRLDGEEEAEETQESEDEGLKEEHEDEDKRFVLAMSRARKAMGADKWRLLSNEAKKKIATLELRKI